MKIYKKIRPVVATVLVAWVAAQGLLPETAASPEGRYSIGLKFGADAAADSALSATDVAGVPKVAQANWNNINGSSGSDLGNLVSDVSDKAVSNLVTITFAAENTWVSASADLGGLNNDQFQGTDHTLMLGYLDTGDATTTRVTISNLPPQLTGQGYTVYVYAMGDHWTRSGGYRILDAGSQSVLKDYVFAETPSNAVSYIEVPTGTSKGNPGVGNYIVFSGLTTTNLILEATTANGLGLPGEFFVPRAPINAIQLVAGADGVIPPVGPTLRLTRSAGELTIIFTGVLQSANDLAGPWTNLADASPLTVTPDAPRKFYRTIR